MCGTCIRSWQRQHAATLPMLILDGCCGIGGITRGLTSSGRNEVWGVDSNPRLRDAWLRSGGTRFICADILEVLADASFMRQFDLVHCSFPCQHWSQMSRCRPGLAGLYPDLITPGRPLLEAAGKPFVIENVAAARTAMRNPVTICMYMFGRETYRHRLLETGGGLVLTPPAPPQPNGVRPNRECGWPHPVPTARAGHWKPGHFVSVAGHERKEPVRRVMEIDWAGNRDDIKEAVPPYVGAWIAEQAEAYLAGVPGG